MDSKIIQERAPRDDDTFRISLRGACLIAANSYEEAFGAADKPATDVAEEMYARLAAFDRG